MDIYKTLINENDILFDKLMTDKPNGEYKKASEKEKFDFYIKQSFINGSPYMPSFRINSEKNNFGFFIKKYKRYYDRYFSENLHKRIGFYRHQILDAT